MIVRAYRTRGIVLKRFNYKEADRVLGLFTQNHGKLSVLAKGVRKITSRRSSGIEIFNYVDLLLHKSRHLDIVMEVRTLAVFPEIRRQLKTVAGAYQVLELVDRLTREGEKQERVFLLLLRFLEKLNSPDWPDLSQFKKQLLTELGFLSPSQNQADLDSYIESLIERKLKAKNLYA